MSDIPFVIYAFFNIMAFGLFTVSLVAGKGGGRFLPMFAFVAGIFVMILSVNTDNMFVDYLPNNQVISQNTTNINTAPTANYFYSVSNSEATDSQFVGSSNGWGENFTSTSAYKGQTFNCMQVPLKITGAPTGLAYLGVFSGATNGYMKKVFGAVDVTTLSTTGYKNNNFCLPIGDTYTIQANDVIGVYYDNGSSANFLSSTRSTSNDIDGTNTIATRLTFSRGSWSPQTAVDFAMTLSYNTVTTNVKTLYNSTAIPVKYQFGINNVKVYMAVLGASMVMVGALEYNENKRR